MFWAMPGLTFWNLRWSLRVASGGSPRVVGLCRAASASNLLARCSIYAVVRCTTKTLATQTSIFIAWSSAASYSPYYHNSKTACNSLDNTLVGGMSLLPAVLVQWVYISTLASLAAVAAALLGYLWLHLRMGGGFGA